MRVMNAGKVQKPPKQIQFDTTLEGFFTLGVEKTGAGLTVDWGDGDTDAGVNEEIQHEYADGAQKTIKVKSSDRFAGLTRLAVTNQSCLGLLPPLNLLMDLEYIAWAENGFEGTVPSFEACAELETIYLNLNQFSGALPSFAACAELFYLSCYGNALTGALPSFAANTSLELFECYQNQFSGALPSFATCTALTQFQCWENGFTGSLPIFAACTALQYFDCSFCQFSGALPDFSPCTALTSFFANDNLFSGYTAGSLATQVLMTYCWLQNNDLDASVINAILADLVTNEAAGALSRNCNADLSGNAAPTGQGVTDAAALVTAGWTVTTD